MAALNLPPNHDIEKVRPDSPFIGQRDYSTQMLIGVNDTIVVCRRKANPGVTTVEAWKDGYVAQCYNCSAPNPFYGNAPPKSGGKPGLPAQSSSWLPLVGIGVLLLFAVLFLVSQSRRPVTVMPTPTRGSTTTSGVLVMPTPTRGSTTSGVLVVPSEPPSSPVPPTSTPRPPPSPIRALVLVDALRVQDLFTLADGNTIDLSSIGAHYLDIVARPAEPVGSIVFLLDGGEFCVNGRCLENTSPYSMVGDVNGDYYENWDWTTMLGTHTITAIPFSGANMTGEELPALTVRFTVTR